MAGAGRGGEVAGAALTFLAAAVTLLTEAVPWVRAVSRDLSVVRADSSPLIWELNWPWASRRTSFASAVMALMSAVTVVAVVTDGVRVAKLVRGGPQRGDVRAQRRGRRPLPAGADAVADGDAVTVGTADPLADADGELEEELQEATASATGTARSPAFPGADTPRW